ncbi:twin-arginine translocase subunit TatC [Polymorphobacter fuscus]|uniref:Sec-independent protein translocase protein TatC n=1 Tax=Sandarakinorhabdus fusca TaxID=1439888 RepID=A0A7C9GPP3_9SPHN|nr:twin-arginine translocase subunit TatC [Polymorphobacter fuscus]KAB7646454.1 twin-arginine translocase subunit TatC [Polymorphobacter fuscus]MQT17695.1 twin-arginine translocase subunit TatC [Polymorphobacter fuscus]NJC09759.1 sec-independent protein translocase protein TatC [Polymorphobacter fuscus]
MSDDADIEASKAPLLDHLIELRGRLLKSLAAFVICFGIAFTQSSRIFGFLVQPLVKAYGDGVVGKLIYTKLYEAFFVEVKVAAFAAFCMAFPIIANQLWAFVAPGLYRREKKAFLPFLLATPVLFTMGAALAYYVVMPVAFRFFLGFQSSSAVTGISQEALPAMGEYLDLVMNMILGFGVAFLLPVLLMLLERAGIVTRLQLKAGRRYAIVGAFAVSAVLTPPDVWSQFALAIPMMLLYEISIIGIWLTERQRERDKVRDEIPA